MSTSVGMTEGQLFDYCHQHFGWGDYDDIANRDEPWFRQRAKQVSRIKALCKRTGVSVEQLYQSAAWCVEQGVHVRALRGLTLYLFQAEQEARERARAQTRKRRDEAINQALEREYAINDGESSRWIEILVRASGPERGEVLTEWTRLRGQAADGT